MKGTLFTAFAIVAICALLFLNFFRGKQPGFVHSAVYTEKAPKPIGPYSQGILTGNTLFLAGQIALDPISGQLDTSSIAAETKRVMENLSAVLEAARMNMSNVVKTTIYLDDLANFKAVNDVYGSYFKENPPARETVQAAALPKGARVEISMIAVK